MKITLKELRCLINEVLNVDSLPTLAAEWLGPGTQPQNVVDIESIFDNPVKFNIHGPKVSDLKKAIKTKIPAKDLIPTQEHVFRDGLKAYMQNPPKELPLVILDDGKFYVIDHTRVAAQIALGNDMINVKLLQYFGRGTYGTPISF